MRLPRSAGQLNFKVAPVSTLLQICGCFIFSPQSKK